MSAEEDRLRVAYCDADQGHIFRFWDELSGEERKALLLQLASIDLDQLLHLIEVHLADREEQAPPRVEPGTVVPRPTDDTEGGPEARERGEAALRAGEVAVLVAAGGQATRLGFNAPKGTLPITPVTRKSLFRLHAEKVCALQRRYGVTIPVLLLVSPHNHRATRHYFEKNGLFGLEESQLHYVEQGMLPAIDRDGRLLLAERGKILLSPDGHGGLFRALHRANAVEFLRAAGVRTLFYFQVDNPLVRVCDPLFLGLHREQDAEFSLKVVQKRNADERVGLFAKIDGRPGVIEYSDTPPELAAEIEDSGRLRFGAGSIGIHLLELAFVERIAEGDYDLPYHMARKRVAFLDAAGELQQPSEPNARKFESYVFDALRFAERVLAVEVKRSEEFAPVKNREGEDSVETALRSQSAAFRSWLRAAHIAGAEGESDDALVEIGPLFALDSREFCQKIRQAGLRGAKRILFD